VSYIITPAEREAFLKLGTNEEREQFIENFWQQRNPDRDSQENTAKEEHYRRIAYANEHFSSGVPGWKTDRGQIYILWDRPMKSNRTRPVTTMIGRCGKAAAYTLHVTIFDRVCGQSISRQADLQLKP